jgi:acyl-CoA thioester hydrolase
MISVHKSVAQPWQCDVLDHLTTRYYVGMFDDASYHFIYDVFGWVGNQDADAKLAWVDVQHLIKYQAEVAAGDLLEVRASLMKIGNKSITAAYVMQNLKTGEVAATLEAVYVLFDLEARCGVKIGDDLRSAASKHLETD